MVFASVGQGSDERVTDVVEVVAGESAAERQLFAAPHGEDHEAVEEPVRELGPRDEPQQLVFGDVADDRDVRAGRAHGCAAGDRLQRLSVPRVAHHGRERVPLARQDLEDLGEFWFENQPALVTRTGVVVIERVADLEDQPLT
jgi:hypothetical protein